VDLPLLFSIHPKGGWNMTVLSVEEKGDLLQRGRVIGVPRNISLPFIHLVIKWCEASGIEWTVNRLKQVKVDFLRKKAGLPPVSVWIRKGKTSTFGGVIGALECYSSRSSFRFERTLALLNVYTHFLSPQVTENQAKKFLSGVTAKAVIIPSDIAEVVMFGFRLSGLRPFKGELPKARPLLNYFASPSKRAPVPRGTVPEVEGVIDSIRYLGITSSGIRLYHDFIQRFKPVLLGLEPEVDVVQHPYTLGGVKSASEPQDVGDLYVGRIGLIQEPGYKLRSVANPGRVFQRVLEPLGNELFSRLKSLPWDCTFSQSKADNALLSAISQNKEVFSVDLSGATDYFPLDLQMVALKALIPDSVDTDLFQRVSKGRWHLPKGFNTKVLSEFGLTRFLNWTKGQPLGLYPSFAAFALTHGLLLQGLLGKEWDEEFFILGDDVVILDRVLYDKYRTMLSRLGCPVSESKTLNSTQVAEFRSIVYTKDGMIPQFKWRHVSDESFIDIVKNMPYLFPLLQPKQRTVVRLISGLPESVGGLGWNPKGLTLDERLSPFLPMLLSDYVARDRVTGYTGLLRNMLYNSSLSQSATTPGLSQRTDLVPALDQRARSLVSVILGSAFVPIFEQLGRNLDVVVEGNLDLPIPGVRVGRVTTLRRWESTLQHLGFSIS
jgi:hypothetical protein